MVDRCAICGDPIPEGRQVCPLCEDKYTGELNHDKCVVADTGHFRRRRLRDLFARHHKRGEA